MQSFRSEANFRFHYASEIRAVGAGAAPSFFGSEIASQDWVHPDRKEVCRHALCPHILRLAHARDAAICRAVCGHCLKGTIVALPIKRVGIRNRTFGKVGVASNMETMRLASWNDKAVPGAWLSTVALLAVAGLFFYRQRQTSLDLVTGLSV